MAAPAAQILAIRSLDDCAAFLEDLPDSSHACRIAARPHASLHVQRLQCRRPIENSYDSCQPSAVARPGAKADSNVTSAVAGPKPSMENQEQAGCGSSAG